jgi:DNA-directed RNA polymerase subunit RPC12/RpoP
MDRDGESDDIASEYICGNCGKNVKLDKDAEIKCHHCGYRIFYKKRDRKML